MMGDFSKRRYGEITGVHMWVCADVLDGTILKICGKDKDDKMNRKVVAVALWCPRGGDATICFSPDASQ